MAFNRILYSDLAIAKSDGLSVSLYVDGQVFVGDVKTLEVDGVVRIETTGSIVAIAIDLERVSAWAMAPKG